MSLSRPFLIVPNRDIASNWLLSVTELLKVRYSWFYLLIFAIYRHLLNENYCLQSNITIFSLLLIRKLLRHIIASINPRFAIKQKGKQPFSQ
jgi:hypothetical protein